MKHYYSNGKLLLTGEYVVLDGALALALPTTYGQSLEIKPNTTGYIDWRSYDENHTIWFQKQFSLNEIKTKKYAEHDNISKRLIEVLGIANQLNPHFLNSGFTIETKLTFAKDWGLGTSSTLINNIANWANVDAYKLLELTFGGSGYDLACAQYNTPLTYKLTPRSDKEREINAINFNPSFNDHLFFVYLNKKQNSRDGIKQYESYTKNKTIEINEISTITKALIACNNLNDFNRLINTHENIIGSIIKETPIKKRLFNDFNGSIKSLGAWGGDFILVSSKDNPTLYFESKGLSTIIPYNQMVI